jgi:hypothetical protein
MAAFDNNKQHMVLLNGIRKELGSGVTIAGVSGQTFTVATKLRKIKSGMGVMETDGMNAIVTTGVVTGGQVTFTRLAPITTSADTISYELHGY